MWHKCWHLDLEFFFLVRATFHHIIQRTLILPLGKRVLFSLLFFFFFFFSWLKCKIDPLHFTFCHVSTLTLVSVNSVFKFQKCFNSGLPLTSVNAQPLGVWIHVCYVLRFCVFLSFFFFTPFPPTGSTDHVQYMNSSHNF